MYRLRYSIVLCTKQAEGRKVYAVRRYNGSFCTQKQPKTAAFRALKAATRKGSKQKIHLHEGLTPSEVHKQLLKVELPESKAVLIGTPPYTCNDMSIVATVYCELRKLSKL